MIAEIVAGASSLTSLGVIAWLVHGRIKAADELADARIREGDSESHVERLQFELEAATAAYEAEKERTAKLLGVLDDVSKSPIDLDLSPADWRGILSRITQVWGSAAEVRVPADRERDAVSSQPAAEPSEPAPMSPIGDVLR